MSDEELSADELANDPFEPKASYKDVTDEKHLQRTAIKNGRYHAILRSVKPHTTNKPGQAPSYSLEMLFAIIAGDYSSEIGKTVKHWLGMSKEARAQAQLWAVRMGIYDKDQVFGQDAEVPIGFSVFSRLEGGNFIIDVETPEKKPGDAYDPNPKIKYAGIYATWDERVKDVPKCETGEVPLITEKPKPSKPPATDNSVPKKTKKPKKGVIDWGA